MAIASTGYDLSINRYKEVVHEEIKHRPPASIIADLRSLEADVQQGLSNLEALL